MKKAKSVKFTATQFTPTGFHTTEDKARFANQFVAFVESGFALSKFTHRFYSQLSNCFGYIAHYNRDGFYDVWFVAPAQRLAFIDHLLSWGCFGSPAHTYSDVERVLLTWLRAHPIRARLKDQIVESGERAELELLARLVRTYPIQAAALLGATCPR